ncbi:hypothetical protein SsS58_00422 [Streptomyces scabiei]|uniref:Uncharacterized protein n=1 Tax=Streptomyces scabiei TaxID=1930 RepID=A0A117ECC3_STRSC|nr:hypothetical protein SsS58_00422 [Streptomyces scabiei]
MVAESVGDERDRPGQRRQRRNHRGGTVPPLRRHGAPRRLGGRGLLGGEHGAPRRGLGGSRAALGVHRAQRGNVQLPPVGHQLLDHHPERAHRDHADSRWCRTGPGHVRVDRALDATGRRHHSDRAGDDADHPRIHLHAGQRGRRHGGAGRGVDGLRPRLDDLRTATPLGAARAPAPPGVPVARTPWSRSDRQAEAVSGRRRPLRQARIRLPGHRHRCRGHHLAPSASRTKLTRRRPRRASLSACRPPS